MGRFLVLTAMLVLFLVSSYNVFAREDMPMMIPQDHGLIPLPYKMPPMPVSPDGGARPEGPSMNSLLAREDALVAWIGANVSPQTGMFLSFQVLPGEKGLVYGGMGDALSVPGVIERVIVEEGLDIYDGAIGQIVLTLAGGQEGIEKARHPLDIYWKGKFGDLSSIRAGFPNYNFIYDPQAPERVTSALDAEGRRGFIFRIINAHGHYLAADPLDGKKRMDGFPSSTDIHVEDWKPVAGENAWVVIAAMQLYHKKYFDLAAGRYQHPDHAVELLLAEELARAALVLQAETGGIRMAPLGTFRENDTALASGPGSWWYNQISTENNLSWYGAFRMLYQVTHKEVYRQAMQDLEKFFKQVYDPAKHIFYQGMTHTADGWRVNGKDFALDVQTWGILSLGAATLDAWFGEGTAYAFWEKSREYAGAFNGQGQLIGVGYTQEHGRVSVEWSAGAIMAARELAVLYRDAHPDWSLSAIRDADAMRLGLESLRRDLPGGQTAYAYSSRRGWIPFGWNSHDPRVMSLASTGWMFFVARQYNPFWMDGQSR